MPKLSKLRKSRLHSRKILGFTLVELLVSMSIIAVLAGIGLVTFTRAGQQSRNSRRKSDLKNIQTAVEAYFAEHRSYPISAGSGWCGEATSYPACGAQWIPNNPQNFIPGYMPRLPRDPRANRANPNGGHVICAAASQNGYLYASNGTDYKILAHCSPEGNINLPNDAFFDPVRPSWAFQVSTPGAAGW